MRIPPPRYGVSEDALRLILHAKNEIASAPQGARTQGRVVSSYSSQGLTPARWLSETAFLRLVSIVEAYVDLISMSRISRTVDLTTPLMPLLVADFEIASTANWEERFKAFERYHGLAIKSLAGWEMVAAGIEVRNCLAHGLGQLTARQRTKTSLAAKVSIVDVAVASNQMHLSATSVTKLADACVNFVQALDSRIAIPPSR